MTALVGRLLGGAAKLAFKYIVVPVAISVATAIVADAVAARLRRRTAELDARLEAEAAKPEKTNGIRLRAVVAA